MGLTRVQSLPSLLPPVEPPTRYGRSSTSSLGRLIADQLSEGSYLRGGWAFLRSSVGSHIGSSGVLHHVSKSRCSYVKVLTHSAVARDMKVVSMSHCGCPCFNAVQDCGWQCSWLERGQSLRLVGLAEEL
eukprot:2984742-Amphidinium_carterae.1